MNGDFDFLRQAVRDAKKAPTAPETPQGDNHTTETTERATGENTNATGQISLTAPQEDRARMLEMYQQYQKNIVAATTYQKEIIQGIQDGKSPYNLLLTAVKAIATLTGNLPLYDRVKGDILAIYGYGLDEKPPLQWELDSTRERLKKLETNLDQTPDRGARQRIEAAIMAHEDRIAELEKRIGPAE